MNFSSVCPVCFQLCEQLVCTPCGHNFCNNCLENCPATGNNIIECPICKKPASKKFVIQRVKMTKKPSVTSVRSVNYATLETSFSSEDDACGIWTDLHTASRLGDLVAIEELVMTGSDIHMKSDAKTYGMCPIHEAAFRGHLDIVIFFVSLDSSLAFTRSGTRGLLPIHCAAHGGSVEVVKYFLDEIGEDIEARLTSHGRTPLHCASNKGHLSLVQFLTERGANIRARSNARDWEDTPLHLAAHFGHLDIVRYFVEEVDSQLVNVRDLNGALPLHMASLSGKYDVVKYFIEERLMDIDDQCSDMRTALLNACSKGHLQIAKYLVKQGANPRKTDNQGWTTLHCAAFYGNMNMAKFILTVAPSLLNARDMNNETPEELARGSSQLGAQEVANFLA